MIHYLCVKPEVHYQNIGLALLKAIMSQPEYYNRKVMAIASLHRSYLGAVRHEFFMYYLGGYSSVLCHERSRRKDKLMLRPSF